MTGMYRKLLVGKNYYWAKDAIGCSFSLTAGESIIVTDIEPFFINAVNQLTPNDIIIEIDPTRYEGAMCLKPTAIDFKNNCYSIIHKMIGYAHMGGGYVPCKNNVENFTCLTIDGNVCRDIIEPNRHVNRFIFQCRSNKYSQEINIDSSWIKFCENKGIKYV